jgi:hypothetical protein
MMTNNNKKKSLYTVYILISVLFCNAAFSQVSQIQQKALSEVTSNNAETPQSTALTSSAIIGNLQACFGSTTTISTTTTGGEPPYTYSLNGGAFVPSANRYFGVYAGTYYITVKDNAGSTVTTASVTVTQPSTALTFTTSVINATCASSTGSLTITAAGGYGNYTYSIDAGTSFQSANKVAGLTPATYYLVVKDINSCTAAGWANVKPPGLTATAITGNTQVCFGNTSTIGTTAIGGVSPYTYSVDATNNFVPSAFRYFPVAAGSHTITVKDSAGCIYTTPVPIEISQPAAPLTFTALQGGSACTGNAGIAITANGGYGQYSYSNDAGTNYQLSALFTSLGYGNYTIAVKDQYGCAAAAAIIKLMPLTSSAIIGNFFVCAGGSTTISTVPSGGSAPYSYSLDGGVFVPASNRYFNVKAGTHNITVKDNAGCTFAPPSITVTATNCLENLKNENKNIQAETDSKMLQLSAFPNPSKENFCVQLKNGDNKDAEIILTDIIGRKMYQTKIVGDQKCRFGADIKAGIYILQVKQGNILQTIKLIKEN